MLPAVSIVMPCYNQGHFLSQAIQSVRDQTCKDWELIIIDDGSTDSTHRIATEFQDPRIQYYYQNNSGLSAARNRGILSARASAIALLDSDDLWEPEFLERMLGSLNRNPDAAAVYCGHAYIDEAGNKIGNPPFKVVPPKQFRMILIDQGNWLVPSAVVLRKQYVEQMGLFDESLEAVEDTDLWIRLSERHDFIGLNDILVRYRLHEASMSRDPDRMVMAALKLERKLHGPPKDSVASGIKDKLSANASFYQFATRAFMADGNAKKGAEYFYDLIKISKKTTLSIGLWRSLARAYLPLHKRDNPFKDGDWPTVDRNIYNLLEELSSRGIDSRELSQLRSRALLALADEAVRSKSWRRTLILLCRAITTCPTIVFSRPYLGAIARGLYAYLKGGIDPYNTHSS
jgi:glycosyltransferase involved in cell wall biosynthesis